MEKVVGTMPLDQFSILRAQYGVVRMGFEYFDTVKGPRCVVLVTTKEHSVTGSSSTYGAKAAVEVEALDDAFARLKHVTGAEISREGAIDGTSTGWSL